ncbi:MAG: dUTP diphosphatase [Rhizomicrobium sp.]
MKVNIVRLAHALDLPLPAYATEGSAGMDLHAAVEIEIAPGTYAMVPTGIALELPPGTEGQVRPRSGLAAKHGVTVLNAPGTVDSDYRGEIKVLLINHGAVPFTVTRGMRIAQMIVAKFEQVELAERAALSDTARGAGGYGSTGLHTVKQA